MSTKPPLEILTPNWTLDEVLTALGKIPTLDLVRFLKTQYPEEDLSTWDHPSLLELALSLMQTWEEAAPNPEEFLIQATSTLCRSSFEAFVRLLWDEVPVAQPLMWNWNMTVYCLPYDVEIMTEEGYKPIGEIVDKQWQGRVVSWNHTTESLEWKCLRGWMKSPGRQLITIHIVDGASITVTENHPVFVEGRGYVEAGKINSGDVVVQVREVWEDVPIRKPILCEEVLFQEVSGRGKKRKINPETRFAESIGSATMQRVWEDYRSVESVGYEKVLLEKMFLCLHEKKGNGEKHLDLQAVWKEVFQTSSVNKENSTVLQHNVYGSCKKGGDQNVQQVWQEHSEDEMLEWDVWKVLEERFRKWKDDSLCAMWQVVVQNTEPVEDNCKETIRSFLQSRMFLEACSWRESSRVYQWKCSEKGIPLHEGVLEGQKESTEERQEDVYIVWEHQKGEWWKGNRFTPHRLGRNKQPNVEYGDALQRMPQSPERNSETYKRVFKSAVSKIERVLRIPDAVYNIEVEENHNYIADGFLVHNCTELQEVGEQIFEKNPRSHDLICNVSPGCSKSSVWSVLFPCWVWTRMPEARLITASHTDILVTDLAAYARDVMKGVRYRILFPDIDFTESQDSKGYYRNTQGGERFTCTVAGKSPTGHHAHFIICLPGESRITTDKGPIPIARIVDEKMQVKVLGYDHSVKQLLWKEIEEYETSPGRHVGRLGFSDGTYLEATEDHPVFIVDKGYTPLGEVSVGDRVHNVPGWFDKEVSKVELSVRLPEKVYNLKVEGTHNYFAEGVLLHNCDDPIDPKRVLSEAERKTAGDFLTQVIPSRRMRGAKGDICVTMLVAQRLGIGDPTDVMLSIAKREGAYPVKHICLPAELTEHVSPPELRHFYTDFNEDAGADPQGLMDPVRLGKRTLSDQRATLGEWGFAGQYLQAPRPLEGGLFKRIWFKNREPAAPYRCRRLRYWDRACLLSGSIIETFRGPIPIELVNKNDMVLTRRGYRRVLWSGETKKTKTLCRIRYGELELTGTPDHLIWTGDRGWVPMEGLRSADVLVLLRDFLWQTRSRQTSTPLYSMEPGMLKKGIITGQIGGIGKEKHIAVNHCTDLCGSVTKETFLMDTSSITRMVTQTITMCQTSNALLEKSMERDIVSTNQQDIGGVGRRRRSLDASDVISYAQLKTGRVHLCIVVGDADERLYEINGEGRHCVRDVDMSSCERSITSTIVRTNVEVPVYDLEVEGDHEFFANGILVHNSATGSSACYTAGVLMAYDGERLFIEDLVHGRWEPDERNAIMLATAQKDRIRYGKYEPIIYVEAEGGSSGRDAWLGVVRALAGFHVREDIVRGSKDTRAEPWSTQLAAGNVFLVDNGENKGAGRASWDIEALITEHESFRPEPGKRLGRFKDIVDSCSGAFNLLVGLKRAWPLLRTYRIDPSDRSQTHWIIVCSADEVNLVDLSENSVLLISFADPPTTTDNIILENGGLPGGDHLPVRVSQPVAKHISQLHMNFVDMSPEDHLVTWDQPVQPWNKPMADLQLSRDQAKKMWSFIMCQRDKPWQVLLLVDETSDNGRALSAAMAIADIMGMPRSSIYRPGEDNRDIVDEDPPNLHIFETMKLTRHMVVS